MLPHTRAIVAKSCTFQIQYRHRAHPLDISLTAFPLTSLITLLICLMMLFTGINVGRARGCYGIKAPAVTGHETFERAYRIHINTLENAALLLPALWVNAGFVSDRGAAALGALPHFTVEWRLVAINGLDSPGLVELLEETRAEKFDVVVLSIGVNDVTGLRSPSQWMQWQNQLAKVIQTRFGPRLLIHSALPPMHAFTALPQPLRWFLGRWALEMNRQLEVALSAQTKRKLHWPLPEAVSGGMAVDGFHPGPLGYALWAKSLSKAILLDQASSSS